MRSLSRFPNGEDSVRTHERDHDWAIIARHTWSPASKQAVFCQDIVRSLISCPWSVERTIQSVLVNPGRFIFLETPNLQLPEL